MPKLSQTLPFLALLGAYTLYGPVPQMAVKQLVTSQEFSAAHPKCLEWTNTCIVCVRDSEKVSCSLPGIACQPQEMLCKNGE